MKLRFFFLLATLYSLLAPAAWSQVAYRGPIFHNRAAKTAAYTVTAADREVLLDATTGTWSLSLTSSATLGNGFSFAVYNSGSGTITVDPAGAETIRDAAGAATTKTLAQGEAAICTADGSGWLMMKYTTGGGGGGTWGSITGTLSNQTDLQTALNAKQATITFGTGVQTALGVNVGSAGAPVLFAGAGGTPSSITLTNATGLPVSTGISGLGTGVAASLAIANGTSGGVLLNGGSLSANKMLKASSATTAAVSLLTDDGTTLSYTGTGGLSLTGSTAGSLELTQGTAPSAGTTSVKLYAPASVTSYIRALESSAGSTGVYIGTVSGTTVTESKVAAGTSGNVLTSNGTTWTSAAPTGSVANPTATIGLTAVNGSATSAIRSDGAPALSQSIAPTWTGVHTFTPAARSSGVASYFVVTTPADTAQTASTESIGANFTAATRQWSTGALTTQRERVFAAPTYGFVGASTLTTAVNADFSAPIAGTNATLTNRWATRADRAQVTSLFDSSSATSQIGNLVDSVDGSTPLLNVIATYGAGTDYSLTATSAAVTFGTTSPSLTITNAGTYLVSGLVNLKYNGATFASARTVTCKLRRTNNTAADLTNGSSAFTTGVVTTTTAGWIQVRLNPVVYTTANTNDAITIFVDVSVVPTAGSLDATSSGTMIIAERKY